MIVIFYRDGELRSRFYDETENEIGLLFYMFILRELSVFDNPFRV